MTTDGPPAPHAGNTTEKVATVASQQKPGEKINDKQVKDSIMPRETRVNPPVEINASDLDPVLPDMPTYVVMAPELLGDAIPLGKRTAFGQSV